MRFAAPYVLLLLLAVPLWWWFSRRRQRSEGIAYPAIGAAAVVAPSFATRLHRALPLLRAVVMILCILAMARPQWGVEATRIYREGIAIAMVVDISSSMAALDLQIDDRQSNRLDVVKATFRDFVQGDDADLPGRDGDLIGMITFAGYADSLSPLTLDHTALVDLLGQIQIVPLPEEDGTAIGDAVVLGIDRLRRTGGSSRVMILLTDGSHNAGDADPLEAAQIASALGIKIYTIGAGSRGIAMMPARARDGGIEFRPTPVFIDEYTLEAIAEATGGRYFRATDSDGLRAIYAEIDRLETSRNVAEHYQQYVEVFAYFLLPALALLLLEILLINTRLRAVP